MGFRMDRSSRFPKNIYGFIYIANSSSVQGNGTDLETVRTSDFGTRSPIPTHTPIMLFYRMDFGKKTI